MPLSNDTKAKLTPFLHRRIKPGECFLLARLLADKIPVMGVGSDVAWEQTLKHRQSVDAVMYSLNDFMHVATCDRDDMYRMIERLWMWRYNVAQGKSDLLFRGDGNHVVDDFSGVMKCVNVGDICALTDIIQDANYIYSVFKDVVESTWQGA